MKNTYDRIVAVYRGSESSGGVVFQPRLKHWYDVNLFAGTMPKKYQGMYLDEVYRELKVTPREVWNFGGGFMRLKTRDRDEVQAWVTQREDNITTEYRTPKGTIRQVERLTEHGTSRIVVEHLLKNLEDVKIYEYILEERRYEWDQCACEWGEKRFGRIIPLRVNLERAPLMWLIIGVMGFQRTITMLWKHQMEMEELLRILELETYKMLDVCGGKSIVELNFRDNMHHDLCSPPLFKKYLIPFYERVVPKVHENGMYATSHWDGFLKQLLPLAKETGLDGLECVTPLPQGDVTVQEMQAGLRGMFLRDGIPAVLFCPWMSLKTLKDLVERLLEAFYPRLILGISDLLPANADISRIAFVNKIVTRFNKSLKEH